MPYDDKNANIRIQARLMRISGTLAVLTWLVAVLSLVGSSLGLPSAGGRWPVELMIRPNTVVCLLAAAAALWLLLPVRRPVWRSVTGYLLAAFVTATGAASLLELLVHPSSDLGKLLVAVAHPAVWIPTASHMGPNTAFCLLAVGLALLFMDFKGQLRGWLVQIPALLAWLIVLAAVIGYLDDVRSLYVIQTYSRISALTSISILLLTTGLLLARPGRGFIRHMSEANPGSTLLRRLVPLTVAIPVLVGWLRLSGEKAGLFSLDGGAVLFTVVDMLVLIAFVFLAIAPLNAMLREVRRTNKRIDKEKATLAAILRSADHSIISTDEEGTIRTFNNAAERWLGYGADEVIGRQSLVIFHDPKEIDEWARQGPQRPGQSGFEVLTARARQGFVEEHDWTYIRKDGSRFPVSLTITALHDEDGEITGFLGIASDITGRLEVDRMKNEFISTVSHELRTPLTSIRGALALLDGGMVEGVTDEAYSLVHIAYNNSERLIRLINDILDVEKIASGKLAFEARELTLDKFLSECLAANRQYANQHDVTLHLHNNAPGNRLCADPDRLAQVMNNLLSNAAKFSPPGATVDVSLDRGPRGVRVAVADRGRGVPEAFRTRIFERFVQVDASDRRRVSGTGLGLNICKSIVEHMGGAIGYEPRPGGGSIFYVDLPLIDPTQRGAGRRTCRDAAAGPRVLICEGDSNAAEELAGILAAGGFDTEYAPDADSARNKLAEGSYVAVILDILLPGEDGLSFLSELRGRPDTKALPVIVVSMATRGGAGTELQGGMLPTEEWLKKPVDTEHLLQVLREKLSVTGNRHLRILHVEDDADLREVVRAALSAEAEAEVVGARDLAEARHILESEKFDLVILDLMLPDGKGDQLIDGRILNLVDVPVLVFSAYDPGPELAERVAGVLAKSRTTNDELVQTVRRLVRYGRPGIPAGENA